MKLTKKLIAFALIVAMMCTLMACGKSEKETFNGLVIVYTNDMHCYLDNEIKTDSGTEPGLRLSTVSQVVKDLKASGNEVLLVDAGDEISGGIYGTMDSGETVISLMNAVGYDLATFGNHEFDYGVDRLTELTKKADYPYISCNFYKIDNGTETRLYDAYRIFEVGGKKIAFIGISTPETLTASTPVYFQDENGNFIYGFDGSDDAEKLYASVQEAIDAVRKEADYVIALAHTGVAVNSQEAGISSYDVIRNTTGLDAYIDGHSHNLMEGDKVKDKNGDEVLLTQTGSYLESIGEMTISKDGEISTKLIKEYGSPDASVASLEDAMYTKVESELGKQVAVLSSKLYIKNPLNEEQRLIRSMEMNLGDYVADSVYWYLNVRSGLDCDLALVNGGGIRDNIDAGTVTYGSIKKVQPFGNTVCMIRATGQEILDALETGANVAGAVDEQTGNPAENGGFLQVAGLTYKINASVTSSLELDENGMFKAVTGEYRVSDVEVYNREKGVYEALDLNKTYTIGGTNYILHNGGNGLSMFMDNEMVSDCVGADWLILCSYAESFKPDGELPLIKTENSPLAAYSGYKMDYENPYGAGRISITDKTGSTD